MRLLVVIISSILACAINSKHIHENKLSDKYVRKNIENFLRQNDVAKLVSKESSNYGGLYLTVVSRNANFHLSFRLL